MSDKLDFTAVDPLTTSRNLPFTPFVTEEKGYLGYVPAFADKAWEDSYYYDEGKEKKCLSSVSDIIRPYEKIFSGVESAYRREKGENSDRDTWNEFSKAFRRNMSAGIFADILSHFNVESDDGIKRARVILGWNEHVLTFYPAEKEERLGADISVVIRLYRTPTEIAYFSLLPVMRILGGTDSVEEALLRTEVSIEYREREIELRQTEIEKLSEELGTDTTRSGIRQKKNKIETAKKEILNSRLAISSLKCYRKQVRDYFIAGRREEPLTKRILRDIITSFDWTYDVPGFLTKSDMEDIYSYSSLVINERGDRAVYLSELRDISGFGKA